MGEITGKHVLAITVSAFAVIIGVNVVMAWKAISTFPGLEVKNSYVASQTFDADRAAQQALGWTLVPEYLAKDGALRLTFTDAGGLPADVQGLSVLVGRATDQSADQRPEFARVGGAWMAAARLEPGNWMMQVEAKAMDGTLFRQRLNLIVKE